MARSDCPSARPAGGDSRTLAFRSCIVLFAIAGSGFDPPEADAEDVNLTLARIRKIESTSTSFFVSENFSW
jgi:hypothetical protein